MGDELMQLGDFADAAAVFNEVAKGESDSEVKRKIVTKAFFQMGYFRDSSVTTTLSWSG